MGRKGGVIAAGVVAVGLVIHVTVSGASLTAGPAGSVAVLVALAAAVGSWGAARHGDRRLRAAWLYLAAALVAWSTSVVVPGGHHVDADSRFASGDAAFLAFLVLIMAAVLTFASVAASVTSRARVLVDGLILGGSLLFVSWALVVRSLWDASEVASAEHALAIAYPFAAVALLAAAILVLTRTRREFRTPLALFVSGLASATIAVALDVYRHLAGAASMDVPASVAWILGFVLFGAAALTGRGRVLDGRAERHDPSDHRVGLLLPYGVVLVGVVVAMVEQVRNGFLEPFLFWTAVVVVLLLVARQILSLNEIAGFNQALETRLVEQTAELRHSAHRFRSLVEHSFDVVTIIDTDSLRVTYVSDSVTRVFGHRPEELLGTPITQGMHDDDLVQVTTLLENLATTVGVVASVQFRIPHRNGSWRRCEAMVKNLSDDPAIRGMVLNIRDVTEQVQLEEQLKHQAFHDALTGLPNRALFTDRLEQAIARSGRTGTSVAVLYLDLDGFKYVNDTYGHAVGDELLVAVADRLLASMRVADTVARFGGDEFALLLTEGPVVDHGPTVAQRIIELFEFPFEVEGRELVVGASVGIAELKTGLEDSGELLRNADVAMYMAKNRGRGRYECFDPGMHTRASERLALASELRLAIERDEFFVEYQPIVELRTGELRGVEALVRWRHPERGVIGPTDFIPLAEDAGLIGPIGSWVLVDACRQVREWQREFPELADLHLNVNLSAWQVRQPGIVEQVAGALAKIGLPASSLTLELTESVLLDDVEEIVDRLTALKSLGVNLAIDDFGTGYSSLGYLQRFPIDVLKIDRTFVHGIERGPEDSALAHAVIKLGRTFRLETVAEGIEDHGQVERLLEMGCEYGQGFYFSESLHPDALVEFALGSAAVHAVTPVAEREESGEPLSGPLSSTRA